jgi:hypothetical protein
MQPSTQPSKQPSMQPTPHPTSSVPSTSAPTLAPSESPSLSGQPSLILSHHPSKSTPPSSQPSMRPVKTVAQSFGQSATLIPTSLISKITSQPFGNQSFELITCPPAYDEMSPPSYSSGSTVQVNGFIYRCNSYPYEIYCTMPSFQPQSDNELWVDTWAAVAPCKIGVSSTMKPSLKPSSKASKASKGDRSRGATYSPTTKIPTHSPTISARTNQTATINSPTISPESTQHQHTKTISPTYSPMNIRRSSNNASDDQKGAGELEQSSGKTTQNSKTVLWTSLVISAAIIFLVAAVLHRCSRSPERRIFFDFSKDEETCREMPGASGSMSFQTESGPPPAVFVPDEESKCQPDLFGRNFELLAPSSISHIQSKDPIKFKCQPDFSGQNVELLPPSSISRAQSKKPLPLKSVVSPMSMTCLAESSSNTKRDVIAPPGKLGIILKQSLHGCMIQSVKPESPMLGILLPDDLILSFNDIVSAILQEIIAV